MLLTVLRYIRTWPGADGLLWELPEYHNLDLCGAGHFLPDPVARKSGQILCLGQRNAGTVGQREAVLAGKGS